MVAVERLWKPGWKRLRASFASLAQLVLCLGLRVCLKARCCLNGVAKGGENGKCKERIRRHKVERYEKI